MQYRYAFERLETAVGCIANLGAGTDAPDRLGAALHEIHLAKNDICQDKRSKELFEELFSLIDFSLVDSEKGIYKRNFEEMSDELRHYVLDLVIQLYTRAIILFHGTFTDVWAENPTIKTWKAGIKKKFGEVPGF